MRLNRSVFGLMLLCSIALRAADSGYSLVYRERMPGKEINRTYCFKPHGNGYSLHIEAKEDPGIDDYLLDGSLSVLSWKFRDGVAKTDFGAVREGACILLTGLYRGKSVERNYEVGKVPWRQIFPIGFDSLARGNETRQEFFALNPEGLTGHFFWANRLGKDSITIAGHTIEVIHIKTTLTGLLAPFWQANSWHRVTDGRHLRYEAKQGMNAPLSVIELIVEERE